MAVLAYVLLIAWTEEVCHDMGVVAPGQNATLSHIRMLSKKLKWPKYGVLCRNSSQVHRGLPPRSSPYSARCVCPCSFRMSLESVDENNTKEY
jgi:hypothetical protein